MHVHTVIYGIYQVLYQFSLVVVVVFFTLEIVVTVYSRYLVIIFCLFTILKLKIEV